MNRLLLTFYGDDFTGSTDAMEALAVHGVPSVLFLGAPSAEDLGRFPDCRAVGVAGLSRSQSPAWMDQQLPPVFKALRALGAPFCHYKVCSTFDSSPAIGNIGRAIETGRRVFGNNTVPMIVGVPILRRYVLFGNLFAAIDGEAFRIDRHPTMSRHPVTPMAESDLRRHLTLQTTLSSANIDILALQAGKGLENLQRLQAEGVEVVIFDTLDAPTLREAGRAIWEARPNQPSFLAGSSGIEYALLACWSALGILPPKPEITSTPPVDRLLVVSGSCSPVTSGQIHWALRNGFEGLAINPTALVSSEAEFDRAFAAASEILSRGGSPILHTATGDADVVTNSPDSQFGNKVGLRLGALANQLIRQHQIQRTVIAGGDTSGHVAQALSIQALTMIRPYAPGSPLCRVWSHDPAIDGLEILLKGGQVGKKSLFGDVKSGLSEELPSN